MKGLFALTAVVVLAFGVQGVSAQELDVGDDAPAFDLPGTDGNMHSLADYEGTTVVLAWFPKAFTGG
jgi:peroxiredoxin